MQLGLIITVVSDDKPGIVETLAQAVSHSEGSWLESNFCHLAGKFAGICCIQIDAGQREQLEARLEALRAKGIHTQIALRGHPQQRPPETISAEFSALGPDKKGIVREFSRAFLDNAINIESMDTQISSAPYSGEALFEANGTLSLPPGSNFDELEEALRRIADQLGIDFSFRPLE